MYIKGRIMWAVGVLTLRMVFADFHLTLFQKMWHRKISPHSIALLQWKCKVTGLEEYELFLVQGDVKKAWKSQTWTHEYLSFFSYIVLFTTRKSPKKTVLQLTQLRKCHFRHTNFPHNKATINHLLFHRTKRKIQFFNKQTVKVSFSEQELLLKMFVK